MPRKVNWTKIQEARNLIRKNKTFVIKNISTSFFNEDRVAIAKREMMITIELLKCYFQ
ncbi:hypothetical protein CPAST_c24580 [Clostridium pasteurianum DSM 525 = ATCC 6013]|uniref:Uncharacterized protein n=1 Tax=Clostridium pasteurianum DSM 525 = ATCC 6013 TaxID=1262449 RepID=A0A0H3J940_CLOPA|nr:hypothetical protein [Clostridium pasteurianum]AJA48528.1 hypothetical protein CPAST_c24580 [Clostridium pasteurianum DSM 525 = ATCC 6013]AJA52516.1 hypothetical protein CLPA_c24580 [Clostridium pasteurianum DSM 525 = ATCC 6013]KRU11474.1 hypothetical protein CP6013_00721 [Clostridium pasteurianum DSM 525 = ATCC 6013]